MAVSTYSKGLLFPCEGSSYHDSRLKALIDTLDRPTPAEIIPTEISVANRVRYDTPKRPS